MRLRNCFCFAVLFLLNFLLLPWVSLGQCYIPVPISAGSCSGDQGPIGNGQSINSGEIFWFDGGPATLANINLNGGTLRVCGDLTISSININSGNIVIEETGKLTFSGSGNINFNGNINLINRGVFISDKGINIQNSTNHIWNLNTGTFIINNILTLNSNASRIIIDHDYELGSFVVDELRIFSASAGDICFRPEGCISIIGDITNNVQNSAQVDGSGKAAIHYLGNATLNQNWTNSPSMIVCLDPLATTSGGADWGAAEVRSSCSSCDAALPVELIHFSANTSQNYSNATPVTELIWKTASELYNDYFIVQSSIDALKWTPIDTIAGSGTSNVENTYKLAIVNYEEALYFKLIQVDYDGTTEELAIIYHQQSTSFGESEPKIFPNPVRDGVIGISHKREIVSFRMFDAVGNLVASTNGRRIQEIYLPQVRSGLYIVELLTLEGFEYKNRLIIESSI